MKLKIYCILKNSCKTGTQSLNEITLNHYKKNTIAF